MNRITRAVAALPWVLAAGAGPARDAVLRPDPLFERLATLLASWWTSSWNWLASTEEGRT